MSQPKKEKDEMNSVQYARTVNATVVVMSPFQINEKNYGPGWSVVVKSYLTGNEFLLKKNGERETRKWERLSGYVHVSKNSQWGTPQEWMDDRKNPALPDSGEIVEFTVDSWGHGSPSTFGVGIYQGVEIPTGNPSNNLVKVSFDSGSGVVKKIATFRSGKNQDYVEIRFRRGDEVVEITKVGYILPLWIRPYGRPV